MRSNRSIRLGIALMGGAFLLLILYFFWQSGRSSNQTTVAENSAPTANGVTPVSVQTGRRAAIALVDLPERSIITPDMFRMEELPEGATGVDYITDPQAQAIGFITRRRILRNERLRTTDLVGHISEVGIAGALSPGTRAMVLPLPSKPTFHDLVRVGGYIDVIAAFDQQESRTIVENARVLAVDVFGNDYPPASVAMRGPFKAPARAIRSANPSASTEPESGAPVASTPPTGEAAPAPAPTPTPTPAPQTAPLAPAITIEVTPDQANRISLAQNSGAVLDFILVPRPSFIVPGAATATGARVATVTRAQLAPYAESKKSAGAPKSAAPSRPARGGGGSIRSVADSSGFSSPPLPEPAPIRSSELEPATVNASTTAPSGPAARPTYEIPIYADGTKVRTDVVLKPKD